MVSEKKQILATVKTLPDNATWDDAIYTLYLHSKIKKSEEDIKNGRVITLEELDKEMEAKYESYFIERSQTRHK